MKTQEFLKQLEKERLVAAIREAESGNSGDVVLFISHKNVVEAMSEARAVFDRLKLEQTTPQNSVLIFVAPKAQKLAVIGGTDLYAKLPVEWWTTLVSNITTRFSEGRLTEGLLTALEQIGIEQRRYFPIQTTFNRDGQRDLLEEN